MIHHHSLQKPPEAHVLLLMSRRCHSQTPGAAETAGTQATGEARGFFCFSKRSESPLKAPSLFLMRKVGRQDGLLAVSRVSSWARGGEC